MTMKQLLFSLLIIFISSSVSAQTPALLYIKNLSGNKHEYPGTACPSFDGGVIVAIGSTSTSGNVNLSCNPSGSRNIFQKYNSSGKLEWEKCLVPTTDSVFSYMYEISNGDLILGGLNGNLSGPKGRNIRIRRQKYNDDIIWSKELGGSADDHIKSMTATTDGAYILFGHSNSDDGDVGFHYGQAGLFDYDLWAIKVDTSGKVLWSEVIGGTGNDKAVDICPAPDGGCYIIGQTTSMDHDCAGAHNPNYIFAYVARLDIDGKLLWYRKFGSNHGAIPLSCAPNGKGGIVIAAQSDTGGGDVTKHIGGYDFWVVNIDSSNNILWDKNYGSSAYETPASICLGTDNSYWIAGSTVDKSFTNVDAWIINIDTSGKLLKSKKLGALGEDKATRVCALNDGLVLVGGIYNAAGPIGGEFPSQFLGGTYDAFLTILAPWTTEIHEANATNNQVIIYPNPSNELLHFDNKGIRTQHVEVYNISGKKITEFDLKKGSHSIDVENWKRGTYIIHLLNSNNINEALKISIQ